MILFPEDIQAINDLLSQRADLDPELLQACQDHINHGQYADAVFKAFRLLEGRIQLRSGIQGETAARLVNEALATRGPLTQMLGLTGQQASNFRDLLKGAFAVFRNPEAHPGEAILDYGSAECQTVLAFVNLLLGVLDRKPETPLDAALRQLQGKIGADATARLRSFLGEIAQLKLTVREHDASFSYRAYGWRPTKPETPPKRALTTVFNLRFKATMPTLSFHAYGAWDSILGFSRQSHIERLKALGGVDAPRYGTVYFDLRQHNQAATFEQLYAAVRDIVDDMEATLNAQEK